MTSTSRTTFFRVILLFLLCTVAVAQDTETESVKNSVEATVKDNLAIDEHATLRSEIQKAWDKRLLFVKSAHFAIETTHECNPLYASVFIIADDEKLESMSEAELAKLANEEGVSYVNNAELLVDGPRVRFTQSGQEPVVGPPVRIGEFSRLSVTDGKVSKSFFDKSPTWKNATGFILDGVTCGSILEPYTLPLRAWADPGRHDFCRVVERTPSGTVSTQTTENGDLISLDNGKGVMYFDAELDFSLVKWEGLKESLEIEYQQDEHTKLWVPSQWKTITYMEDGSIGLYSSSHVTKYEINPIFTDKDFQFEFPPKSTVSDYRPTAKNYDKKRGSEFYVIKANGDKRQVNYEERFSTVDDLLNSDQGEMSPKPKVNGKDYSWFWIINGAFFLLIVVAILIKKYRNLSKSN